MVNRGRRYDMGKIPSEYGKEERRWEIVQGAKSVRL